MELLITLLIFTLAVNMVFDTIRIVQYIKLRKKVDKEFIELEIRRINEAYDAYAEEERCPMSFGEYLVECLRGYTEKENDYDE